MKRINTLKAPPLKNINKESEFLKAIKQGMFEVKLGKTQSIETVKEKLKIEN
jgi:hypothetical protein